METCGYNCTRHNFSVIARGKARRAKFDSEAAFLALKYINRRLGTRLKQDGNILIQTYTPQSFTHPMRCYCSLLSGLPTGEQVSPTYCNCSKAFVQTQTIL